MTEKMTKRNYLEMLKDIVNAAAANYEFDVEGVTAFIDNEIAILEKRKEASRARSERRRQEGDELREQVYSVLKEDEAMTINQILKELDNEELTSNKIVARLKNLVDTDRVEKSEVSVGEEGKKRKVTAYRKLA